MSETVCISKERYEYLIHCERLIDMEFDERFAEEFVKEVKESEDAYKNGEFVEVKDSKERRKLFDTL